MNEVAVRKVAILIKRLRTAPVPCDFDDFVKQIKELGGQLPDNIAELRQQCVDRGVAYFLKKLRVLKDLPIFDGFVKQIKELGGQLPANLEELREQCKDREKELSARTY